MASPPLPSSDKLLQEELRDAGNRLSNPPSSPEELLNLLDKLESLLSKIEQGPSSSVHDALQPSMRALTGSELFRHANVDVKVSIASCISEITRIMAPNTPYSDEEMKEYFLLSVMAFEKLSSPTDRCYLKAVSVIRTLANIRVCVLMLDLELDALIVKMFQQFLATNRSRQPDAVLLDMERIMTLVIEESEEPSFELLNLLVISVKRENQIVSPLSWELGRKVLTNCADKLKSDLPKAVRHMGILYHDYAEIVASICQDTRGRESRDFAETEELASEIICPKYATQAVDEPPKSVMSNNSASIETRGNENSPKVLHNDQQGNTESRGNSQLEKMDIREATTDELHPEAIQKKRGRKPNSLRKEEEGYDHAWIIGVSSSLNSPCRGKNSRKRNCNPSKGLTLEELASQSEHKNETQPHVFTVRNVHGKSTSLSPSKYQSVPDEIQPKLHQQKKIESEMNQDSGLNLLSVSVGNLLRAQDEDKTSQRADATLKKENESSGHAKSKRRRAPANNASKSTGDAKPKRRRALGKSVSESTGDATESVGRINWEVVLSPKSNGICSDLESKQQLSDTQINNMEQKRGTNATDKPAHETGFDEASKVKNKRKSFPTSKEEDRGEELVGRKIRVWWPADRQFYEGVVTAFDPERKKHKVEYIDGDEEILSLREECWKLVEDGEDSEATEDTKPSVNTSANRLCNAQNNSSGPAKINHKSSSIYPKKILTSNKESWLIRSKNKPDEAGSCKRTESRKLREEKGKKSLAEILSISPEPHRTSQVTNACSGAIDVHGYKVKASTAPLLTAIFAKHGNIAVNCLYKSAAVRASLLEVVCNIVKRLQSNPTAVIMSELQAIENEVSDAEAAQIEVSWLRGYLGQIRKVEEVGQKSSMLKDIKANTILVSKAAKRDLEQRKLELVAAQERLNETEKCVKALTCVADKITNDIIEYEAKESSLREPLDELK